MKFAFCILKYFPFGGLQRDFLNIALACRTRGHEVDVYTLSWQGPRPEGIAIHIMPTRGITNHSRFEHYYKAASKLIKQKGYDVVVGFNKMPGLDVYFAGDVCFRERTRHRGFIYRMMPRYRRLASLERTVFDQSASTEIFMLVESEQAAFVKHYGTSATRFHLLPPDMAIDRLAPPNYRTAREEARRSLSLGDSMRLLLMVGSGFKAKGVDRAIRALAALPPSLRRDTSLKVIGQDNPRAFAKLASRLGIATHVEFLGGRDDVPRFLLAADLLVHPAYHEAAGAVLLEAMAAGLPVLATDVCGFGFHIQRADAGYLIPSPYQQEILNEQLRLMLCADREQWSQNGIRYIQSIDVGSRAQRATTLIEAKAAAIRRARGAG